MAHLHFCSTLLSVIYHTLPTQFSTFQHHSLQISKEIEYYPWKLLTIVSQEQFINGSHYMSIIQRV